MKKLYISALMVLAITFAKAQEVITFNSYDGASITETAATTTINDPITVVFEDLDIINNLYTENQTFLHMYLGLRTANGSFQAVPAGFNDLSWQPVLNLTDGDASTATNIYSITFTPGELFPSLDGETILGIDFLLQNQFGGGGNNQTVDMYIDLVDAILDTNTLTTDAFTANDVKLFYAQNALNISGRHGNLKISVYNLLGKQVMEPLNIQASQNTVLPLELPKSNVYIIRIESDNYSKTFKIISK
ncbi:T9SS type A sorting domain-containing protein [Lacinutrix chionoecetis]